MPFPTDPAEIKAALEKDPTTKSWWCTVCQRAYSPDGPCSDCRRHQAIGVLVDSITSNPAVVYGSGDVKLDTCLDAIAELLGHVTRLRRQHNQDIRDEQRGAQQDARAAYGQGLADGSREA